MIFNSVEFLIFFILFFCIYFFPLNKDIKKQNILIFIASYIFYGWWDNDNLYNEFWVRPNEDETPVIANKVEDSCYW